MAKGQYYIGVTNKMISIYNSTTNKLKKPILIPPLFYKRGFHPYKVFKYKKMMTNDEVINFRSKVLRFKILRKATKNSKLKRPQKLYREKYRQNLKKHVYNQRDMFKYTRQVYREVFINHKIKRKEVASICFVLDERDDYRCRAWILKHSKRNRLHQKVHLVNWRTAALTEALARSKINSVNGEKLTVLYVFDEYYHVYNLQRQHNRYHVKDYLIHVNNFTLTGLAALKQELSRFNPDKYLVYLYGDSVKDLNCKFYFEKALKPKPVHVVSKSHSNDMDCLNGAMLKSRSYSRDPKVLKYDVLDACYSFMRINMDNKLFVKLKTYLREYPFTVGVSTKSRNLYYLWIEKNHHGLNTDWKLHQIYPHSFVRDKIDLKVEFDANGISRINVHKPPQAAHEDTRDFTFARFKVRRRKRHISVVTPPLKFKASGKRITRNQTPTNYRQRKVYQIRKKPSPPPVKKRSNPNKPKRKINDPMLKNKLRTTAERMNILANSKFLME